MATNGRMYQLNHCLYICQYHLVWIPRFRGRVMADTYIKAELKRIFKLICRWKGFTLRVWRIGDEHIYLYLTIPPKHSISFAVAVLKGKSSAWIKKKNKKIPKGSFWARGYFVSTIGINEHALKKYIENQQHQQVEPLTLPFSSKKQA